ncbi:MAG: hypothetical protein V3V21_00030, partial [Thermoplasmata archaeon]
YVFLHVLGLAFLAPMAFTYVLRKRRNGLRRTVVIATVTTSVLLLFFFSFSSTLAGFERSPFVGDQAYVKQFETPWERQSAQWMFDLGGASVDFNYYRSPTFSKISIGRACWNRTCSLSEVQRIPVKEGTMYDFENVSGPSLILFSEYDVEIGFQSEALRVGRHGQVIYTRISPESLSELNMRNRIFDAGKAHIFLSLA